MGFPVPFGELATEAGTSRCRRGPQLACAAAAALVAVLAPAPAAAGERLRLSLPIDCVAGEYCHVQNYVDIDPGRGVRDFACGSATYDGHDGVDFRLLSTAQAAATVPVFAPADGTVKARRDGVADRIVGKTEAGKSPAGVAGRECGNGVVIDHGGGWETQLCHLRRGSLRVTPGDVVTRGQPVGAVGYSGFAQFAHVHLSVRRDGRTIDPFTGEEPSTGPACTRDQVTGLWTAEAARKLAPPAAVTFLGGGFAGAEIDNRAAEVDHTALTPFTADAGALFIYARLMNVRAGDRVRFEVTGPGGFAITHMGPPAETAKATYIGYAGRRAAASGWPRGIYRGRIVVERDGSEAGTLRVHAEIE